MIKLSEEIPFPEWAPDLGRYKTGATVAKGCFSYGGIYKPIQQLGENSDALPDDCYGAYSMRTSDGVTHTFAATRTKIYKLNDQSWDDVTWSSGDYNTGQDGFWIFTNFGDLVIATNYNDDIQVMDVLLDSEFSQLSSTAPRARYIFIVNNFLVALDTIDSDGVIPTRVRWSPLGQPGGDWTPSINTQAGFNDLFGGGFVNVAGTGNQDFGTIIQDTALWRMEYIGGDQIFTFSIEVQERGTKLARSVKTNGTVTYFLDEDGFYSFNGRQAFPIGRNKVDKWFYSNFNSSYDYNLTTSIDPINRLYLISFPTVTSGDETPDLILIYNEVDQRWTYLEQPVHILFEDLSKGYTLESLSAEYPNLETVPYSLDSRFWQGGRFLSGAITSDMKLGAFNGQVYQATIGTTETRIDQSGKANVTSIQPIIESGTIEVRLGFKDKINDTVTYSNYATVNSITGEIDIYQNSRFILAEFRLTNWDIAKGFAYRFRSSGVV